MFYLGNEDRKLLLIKEENNAFLIKLLNHKSLNLVKMILPPLPKSNLDLMYFSL